MGVGLDVVGAVSATGGLLDYCEGNWGMGWGALSGRWGWEWG